MKKLTLTLLILLVGVGFTTCTKEEQAETIAVKEFATSELVNVVRQGDRCRKGIDTNNGRGSRFITCCIDGKDVQVRIVTFFMCQAAADPQAPSFWNQYDEGDCTNPNRL